MIDHLNEFKKSLKSKSKDSKGSASVNTTTQSNLMIFKLFGDLQEADLERVNKVAELNNRLLNLEKVFGAGNASVDETQIEKLCTNIENKSILVVIFQYVLNVY